MKLFCEGTLVAVEKGEFDDNTTGDKVQFFKNFLQCDDTVVTLGSGKTDYSKLMQKHVVCEIEARIPQGEKLHKLTIRKMTAHDSIDEPEGTIN